MQPVSADKWGARFLASKVFQFSASDAEQLRKEHNP